MLNFILSKRFIIRGDTILMRALILRGGKDVGSAILHKFGLVGLLPSFGVIWAQAQASELAGGH